MQKAVEESLRTFPFKTFFSIISDATQRKNLRRHPKKKISEDENLDYYLPRLEKNTCFSFRTVTKNFLDKNKIVGFEEIVSIL